MLASMWPTPAVTEFRQVTYRRGAVSSARFTPDGRSFVYSASWEGKPYAAFLGRPESPDVRDLELADARILSISQAGDMAMLFGPQNVARVFGVRTLARIPMAGGARRDVLTGVVDADWIPGTDALAVVRDPGGGRPWTVEFPVGTTVHEARAAWSLRVSPDGNRVAFFEGPVLFDGAPEAMVTVIDKIGPHVNAVAERGGHWTGLGAIGDRGLVHCRAPRQQSPGPQLHAVSLAGVERSVYTAPDWLVLHDISTDGRVLLSRNSIRVNVACPAAWGRDRARSGMAGVVDRQRHIVRRPDADLLGRTERSRRPLGTPPCFAEARRAPPPYPSARRADAALCRRTDSGCSPTWEGIGFSCRRGPVRPCNCRRARWCEFGGGAWLSDSKRIVFTGDPGDGKPRGYIQEIPDGLPRAITPAGVSLAGKSGRARRQLRPRSRRCHVGALSDSGRRGSAQCRHSSPEISRFNGATTAATCIRSTLSGDVRSPAVDVFRVEITTGARVLWKTLTPSDPVGVEGIWDPPW